MSLGASSRGASRIAASRASRSDMGATRGQPWRSRTANSSAIGSANPGITVPASSTSALPGITGHASCAYVVTGPILNINEPYQADPGAKIIGSLPIEFGGRVPALPDVERQIGYDRGNSLFGNPPAGQTVPRIQGPIRSADPAGPEFDRRSRPDYDPQTVLLGRVVQVTAEIRAGDRLAESVGLFDQSAVTQLAQAILQAATKNRYVGLRRRSWWRVEDDTVRRNPSQFRQEVGKCSDVVGVIADHGGLPARTAEAWYSASVPSYHTAVAPDGSAGCARALTSDGGGPAEPEAGARATPAAGCGHGTPLLCDFPTGAESCRHIRAVGHGSDPVRTGSGSFSTQARPRPTRR